MNKGKYWHIIQFSLLINQLWVQSFISGQKPTEGEPQPEECQSILKYIESQN